MRKTTQPRHVLIAGASLLLAGCAAVGTQEAWNVPPAGSTWQMAQRNTGSYGQDQQYQVVRGETVWEGRNVLTFKNLANGMTILALPTSKWVAILGRDDKPVVTYDPPIGYEYPLKVGKSWSTHHRMTTVATGKVTEFDYSCKVDAQEKVTVRAGTFDAMKVVCTSPTEENTWWSSRETGINVKTVNVRLPTHPQGPGTQQGELVTMELRR